MVSLVATQQALELQTNLHEDYAKSMEKNSVLNVKTLVGAFSVITNLRMDLRFKL